MILDIQDIINSVSVPALIKDEFIKRGTFARLRNGDLQACVGGFSIVFPVEVDGSKWAFRCWHHTLDNDQARIKLLSSELKKAGLPYFIDFEYEDKGIVVNGVMYPTTRMKWINGRDIKDYICCHRYDRHKLFTLASNFFAMTQDLHRLSIAHGDLQHENIIVNQYGKIFLIDYDSLFVPAVSYMNSKNSTNGKEGYQHPSRENCVYANSKLDYFSEVVILTSILAIAYNPGLIDKYNIADSDTMLFKKSDFSCFACTSIFSDLSSMGDIFVVLLNVLLCYLKKQDITQLEPLELAVNKVNPTNALSIADYLVDAVKLENEKKKLKELEEQAWLKAFKVNTVDAIQVYLDAYPDGAHSLEAKRIINGLNDNICWNAACLKKTLQAYREYAERYPSGNHISECKRQIDFIVDNNAWSAACVDDTIESYEQYLKRFRSPIHTDDAKKRIEELSKSSSVLGRLIVIILLALVTLLVLNESQVIDLGLPQFFPEQPQVKTPQPPKPEPDHSADIIRIRKELKGDLELLEGIKQYNPESGLNCEVLRKINDNISLLKRYGDSKAGEYQSRLDRLKE